MSSLSARFAQSPVENKRYLLDYALFVSAGETVTLVVATVTSLGTPPQGSPALVVTNIAIGPGALQVLYFVSGGADGWSYEVTFKATTSIGQILEDVVQYNIAEKT